MKRYDDNDDNGGEQNDTYQAISKGVISSFAFRTHTSQAQAASNDWDTEFAGGLASAITRLVFRQAELKNGRSKSVMTRLRVFVLYILNG
ncbi:hypothetical protein I204_02599 [Kwoniella mangroviensis CBS 8886]|nr:hypothetical protein I204_02599 [Kwoniella mangroviensis CBS 8886]